MPRVIAWKDGVTWSADERTFRLLSQQLEGLLEVIIGLDGIYGAWSRLSAQTERLDVDDFAPHEDDRAVMTAALARAVEEAQRAGAAGLGFDTPGEYADYLDSVARLHELFVTDVTFDPGASLGRRSDLR